MHRKEISHLHKSNSGINKKKKSKSCTDTCMLVYIFNNSSKKGIIFQEEYAQSFSKKRVTIIRNDKRLVGPQLWVNMP